MNSPAGLLAILFIFSLGGVVGVKQQEIKVERTTGKTVVQLEKLKQQCESALVKAALPRNRECKLVISYETQEKK